MTHYNLPHDHGQDVQVVLERMPAAQRFEEAAMSFQQLGDPTRLKILWILCHCRECVSDIVVAVGMSSKVRFQKNAKARWGPVTAVNAFGPIIFRRGASPIKIPCILSEWH